MALSYESFVEYLDTEFCLDQTTDFKLRKEFMAKANSEALVKFPANFVGKKDAQDFVKNVLANKYDGLLTKLKKYD